MNKYYTGAAALNRLVINYIINEAIFVEIH